MCGHGARATFNVILNDGFGLAESLGGQRLGPPARQ